MSFADKFSIAILTLSFLWQVLNRGLFSKYVRLIFFSEVFLAFGYAFYLSFLQYQAFLPPFREWKYFIYYVGSRIFAPLITALISALIFKFASEFLNRRFGERFLEKKESWLFAIGILGSGYPGFVFYVPLVLVAGLLMSIFYAVAGKGRAPFFYLWLPTAIFAILLKSQIPQSALNFFII